MVTLETCPETLAGDADSRALASGIDAGVADGDADGGVVWERSKHDKREGCM